MDDMIYVEQMGKAYEIIDEAYKNVDNKSHNMVMLIGTMFTLQATLFLPNLTTNPIGLSACIMGLICYFISIIFFIDTVRLRKFIIYPNLERVTDYYEQELSTEEYIENSLAYYTSSIKQNTILLNSKTRKVSYAYYLLIIGVVFTMISVIVFGVLNLWIIKIRIIKRKKEDGKYL